MKKLALVIALSSAAMASPALARDGSAYLGIDVGALKPEKLRLQYTDSGTTVDDAIQLRHKMGLDADLLGGYDLGMIRLEVEAGIKRSRVNGASILPEAGFAQDIFVTIPGGYTADGRTSVGSGMLNALLDFGGNEGLGGSIGAGVGLARVKTRVGLSPTNRFNFRDTDRAMALQALAEVRYAVSPNLDVGIKYRYFRTATLDFGPFCVTTCGGIAYWLHGKYKSNSLLASLRYNFYQPAPPPPPPAPPAPPPPPATQTCPDGTVILVTSTCPEPPPPPAPPPPTERGQ